MFSGDLEHMRVVKQERHAKFAQDHGMTRLAMREGHGFIGYSKGRNIERAWVSHSLGLYLLHQI